VKVFGPQKRLRAPRLLLSDFPTVGANQFGVYA
jgi:hypothetical protein